jgi:hypothetical protein
MFTNKTGAQICVDAEGNVVACDDPASVAVAVGAGGKLTAEEAAKYKGLPEGDDNAPAEAEDTDPGDESAASGETAAEGAPSPTTGAPKEGLEVVRDEPPAKQIGSAPADKMERAPATKEAKK